jgi:hypothetical protein
MTANMGDGNPLRVRLHEWIMVGSAWLSEAEKDLLKNLDRELVDRVGRGRN